MKKSLSLVTIALSFLVSSVSFAGTYSCTPGNAPTAPLVLSKEEAHQKVREIINGAGVRNDIGSSSPIGARSGTIGQWSYEASRYSSSLLKGHASLVTEFRQNGQWLYQIEKFDCEWQHLDQVACQFSCQVQNADFFD